MISLLVAAATLATKPNVVLIFLDDAGYGDFGFSGHPTIKTPNLDRLASEGVRSTQFYVSAGACSASRYSLITGRRPSRSGFPNWVLLPGNKEHLKLSETTMGEVFKGAGYRTAFVGKWHLGSPNKNNGFTPDAFPLAHGFDRYFGLPYSNDMAPPRFTNLHWIESATGGTDPAPGYRVIATNPDGTELTRRYTDEAIKFVKAAKSPAFVALFHSMPHVPLTPGKAWRGRSSRGLYGDVIEELDFETGRLAKALKDTNTIIVFTSDNGPWLPKGMDAGSAGLLKDGKGSGWEGGVREPMFVWWPGHIKPGVSRTPWSTVDMLSTLSSLALGKATPTTDGRDATAAMLGKPMSDVPILFHRDDLQPISMRYGRWKYHETVQSQIGAVYFKEQPPYLFDLEKDPSETTNLARTRPEKLAEMAKRFATEKAKSL